MKFEPICSLAAKKPDTVEKPRVAAGKKVTKPDEQAPTESSEPTEEVCMCVCEVAIAMLMFTAKVLTGTKWVDGWG